LYYLLVITAYTTLNLQNSLDYFISKIGITSCEFWIDFCKETRFRV